MRSDRAENGNENIIGSYGRTEPERLAIVEERLKNALDKDNLIDIERKITDLDKSVTNQISGLKDFISIEISSLKDKVGEDVSKAESKNLRWWSLTVIAVIVIASPAGSEVLSFLLSLI